MHPDGVHRVVAIQLAPKCRALAGIWLRCVVVVVVAVVVVHVAGISIARARGSFNTWPNMQPRERPTPTIYMDIYNIFMRATTSTTAPAAAAAAAQAAATAILGRQTESHVFAHDVQCKRKLLAFCISSFGGDDVVPPPSAQLHSQTLIIDRCAHDTMMIMCVRAVCSSV